MGGESVQFFESRKLDSAPAARFGAEGTPRIRDFAFHRGNGLRHRGARLPMAPVRQEWISATSSARATSRALGNGNHSRDRRRVSEAVIPPPNARSPRRPRWRARTCDSL
jgi:hypothetical protein